MSWARTSSLSPLDGKLGLMPQNQGFTKQSAYLRAADVKSIAKGGNRRQIPVIVLIAPAVAEACSVAVYKRQEREKAFS